MLLLLVLIIFCNLHVYPLFFSSIVLNSTSILCSTSFSSPTQHLQFCDDTLNINSLSLTLYQNGKFVSAISYTSHLYKKKKMHHQIVLFCLCQSLSIFFVMALTCFTCYVNIYLWEFITIYLFSVSGYIINMLFEHIYMIKCYQYLKYVFLYIFYSKLVLVISPS